jgi:segregation and condensation protein B
MFPPRLKLAANDDGEPDSAPESAPPELAQQAMMPAKPAADDGVPTQAIATLEAAHAQALQRTHLRIVEAALFAATSPLDETTFARHLPEDTNIAALIKQLQADYAGRGVTLNRVAGKWAFRTADDLAYLLERHATEERKLSKAALETLSIIAYHQPVTRAEVEEIRGVTTSKGTLDVLLETNWIRPRGRRRAPGRPVTYGTTETFLDHFGFDSIKDLPGLAELKGAGLLDGNLPPNFKVPDPTDVAALMPDELPLDAGGDPEPEDDPDLFAALPDEDDEATQQ